MALDQPVENRPALQVLLVLDQRLGAHGGPRQALDVPQLEAPRAVLVVLHAALGELEGVGQGRHASYSLFMKVLRWMMGSAAWFS